MADGNQQKQSKVAWCVVCGVSVCGWGVPLLLVLILILMKVKVKVKGQGQVWKVVGLSVIRSSVAVAVAVCTRCNSLHSKSATLVLCTLRSLCRCGQCFVVRGSWLALALVVGDVAVCDFLFLFLFCLLCVCQT